MKRVEFLKKTLIAPIVAVMGLAAMKGRKGKARMMAYGYSIKGERVMIIAPCNGGMDLTYREIKKAADSFKTRLTGKIVLL